MARPLVPRGDLHLRLDAEQAEAVAAFGARSHLPANAAVRALVQRGLESLDSGDPGGQAAVRAQLRTAALLALGAMVAAEEVRLLMQLMLPSARERAAEWAKDAATSARLRLETLEGALEDYAL